jgi:hypothetical protein
VAYKRLIKFRSAYLAVLKGFFSTGECSDRVFLPTFSVRLYVDKMFVVRWEPYEPWLAQD